MEEARGADQQWLPRRDDGTVERFFAARSTATTTNRGLLRGIFFLRPIFFPGTTRREGVHTKRCRTKTPLFEEDRGKNAKKKMTDAGNTDEENPYEIVVDEEDKGDLGDGNSRVIIRVQARNA